MTNRPALLLSLLLVSLLVCALLLSPVRAAPPPPASVIDGNARFTVITPNCIRIEYAPNGKFVDAPSLFAANRPVRPGAVRRVTRGAAVVETSAMELTYTPDGKPFFLNNLHADIRRGAGKVRWTPGMPNPGNLGGTIRTLDGMRGPVDLGQGLLSRDGWYLLDDSKSPLLTAGWVRSRPADAGTDWYLFGYGDDYHAALQSLTAAGGAVPLPRKYLLGAWYSRYWPFSSDDYRQLVKEYGQHDFPLDNMVLDMDWHKDGWTGWSWNRKLLPDAEALLPWLHAQGLHDTLNLHPADGVGPQEDAYAAFMSAIGADPAAKQTVPFDAADKKYMDALFATVFAPLEKNGVDFWWLDWQQTEFTRTNPNLTNLFWLNTLLFDHTAQGGQRGASFSRWAGWGDHRHPIHFSGDADTGFPMLAFEVPFTAAAGNVGCFFWSHDIGGHMGGRNEESYTRWVQFGAVSPVLRSHSTRDAQTDRRPWNYPAWAEGSMRRSFHLRSELFPYLYTSAAQSARETVPLNRPLYLDNPKIENAYHNAQEFLLGDNVLAAPIVSAGAGPGHVGTQTVWFPPGTWFNRFSGERFAGGQDVLVAADIDEFPLYVRGGVPLPLQPYQARMATAPLTTLRVVCYPGADGQTGRSTVYEDDGLTTAYTRGLSATTPLSYSRRGDFVTVTVGAAKGHFAGQTARRALVIELPDTLKADRVTVNGQSAAAVYDAATNTSRITIPARPVGQSTIVVVQARPGGWDALHAAAAARRVRGLSSASQETILAANGIGLVRKNEGATLYHGKMADLFYAPRGTIDGDRVQIAGGQTVTLSTAGVPITVIGPSHLWRGRTFYAPSQVTFSIKGQTYQLPAALPPAEDLTTSVNITQSAIVTVGSTEDGYGGAGAIDGVVGGYPEDKSQEWSAGKTIGASLRLTWALPQTVRRVVLWDRPNLTDQVTSGILTFSDGSHLDVGPLPNDAKTGLTLSFPAKTITWAEFTVTGVKPGTENAGLAEIAVFKTQAK